MTKITQNLKNDQNTSETQKMTKIPPKPKKWPTYPQNLKNNQNTLQNLKITKIPPKPKNYQNTHKT